MLKRNQVVANRYVVRDIIGKGGMGRIYKVYDKALGEEVAMKTLLPKHIKDKVILERFFNEARIARGLSHPNIVRVHDIGGTDSMVYISMEYLEGKSLRQLLDDLRPGQCLPINGILRIFDALCAALDYAHHFTIHRDIKPENVMILPDGSVRLMDFGISKLMSNPNLTSDSIVMGTPRYMSPEQLRNTSSVDGRSDLYSLGVMLYEVITGVPPTALGKTASESRREIPSAIDPIIEKCVDPEPSKRFQTAGELREALRKIRVAVESGSAVNDKVTHAAPRPGNRRAKIAVGVTLIAAILGGAAFGMVKAEERRHSRLHEADTSIVSAIPEIENRSTLNFEDARELIGLARTQAEEVVEGRSEEGVRAVLLEAIDIGEGFWREAENASTPQHALDLAASALSCFIAPAIWPEEMLFVPPGPVVLEGGIVAQVGAFFIDRVEVSMADFAEFCQGGEVWRWPQSAPNIIIDVPMTYMTYYDAQAYVASQSPKKQLPTEAQWARAIARANVGSVLAHSAQKAADDSNEETAQDRTGILYVYGDQFYEWTSSAWRDIPVENSTFDEVGFQSLLVVCGGVFDSSGSFHLSAREAVLYESVLSWLGFRGTINLPASLDELGKLVRR